MIEIDGSKLIRWECLRRHYFGFEKKGETLDRIFENKMCRDEIRAEVLNGLDLSFEQKDFLLN